MIYLRNSLVVIAMLLAVLPSFAEGPLTARRVFAEAPLEIIDMIRPTSRLDMLDYYTEADSILTVPDALGGDSRIETMTDDYMRVAVTPVSTLEIKILPHKKDFIAMTLYTVGGDSIAEDTEVAFYDADLKPLPRDKFLKQPTPMSFFNIKDAGVTESDLREWIPFRTVAYTTGPGDEPLTATLTVLRALPEEVRTRLGKAALPSRTALWTGKFKFQ